MSREKRERHRVKRARKRESKVRHEAQTAQMFARQERAADAAWSVRGLLERGETREAVAAAARVAALAPRDRRMAELYVAAAEKDGSLEHRRRAYERLAGLGEPDAKLLIALAGVLVETKEFARAAELAERARSIFPRLLVGRKGWLAHLEYVERRCTEALRRSARESEQVATLPLFGDTAAPAAQAEAADVAPSDDNGRIEADAIAEAEATTLEIPITIVTAVDGIATLARKDWSTQQDARLSVLAARIREAESFDRLLAVEQARGLLRLSHQEETARKVLSVFLGRGLLADEVGLGKTIEAGLVLSEYLLRGRVERALILTPPSLVGQWREELSSKFDIETRTTDGSEFRADPGRFWSDRGVVIASLATARTPQQRELVTAHQWDIIIVDEAHALKNARTQSYAVVSRLTSRFLLLLTATPVENDVEELYNLVSLIRPGHLGGRGDFLRRFGGSKKRVTEAVRREIRALLAEIMIRNTRALSGVRLPPRFARTVLVKPHPAEGEMYDRLVDALRVLGPTGRTRFLLSVLLQEAGSSPHALRATLQKVRDDPSLPPAAREALGPAIACAERMPETGKGHALLRAVESTEGGTVVFTRFRATLDFLRSFLSDHGVACEYIDGDVPVPIRHEVIARCRERAGVLLSTDVGSEGLNLQFCRRIINFDLPWNPMRIEQRIGRVHRIGQVHPVDVVNLCLAGSIEERILCVLDERINLFELVVGEVEMILGYLDEEGDFSDLMFDAFVTSEGERREQQFTRIADALVDARTRYQHVKTFDEEFFRNELGV
jgi:superfamily II DNA or RNA helicase